MAASRADIIARLRREILPMQGLRSITQGHQLDVGLGQINDSFPNTEFPKGVMHEFCCSRVEDAAATAGFISGILGKLMQSGGVSVWISMSRTIFPPALQIFGVEPDKIIFLDLANQKDVLWCMEEALKCDGIAAVIAEMPELSFTASRRLQLAVESSHVTGFVLRINPRQIGTTACVTRWKISPVAGILPDSMPGVGFPRWNVELLKVRNGKPGSWQIEWKGGRFIHASRLSVILPEQRKKTG
jgi:protein ImuA